MKSTKTHFAAGLAAIAFAAGSAHASTIIYQDDFTGHADVGADGLNAETPDIGAANWVAMTAFGADGSIANSAASNATLAFTPVDGLVYTLDASFKNLTADNPGTPAENDWLALGFANGQSTTSGRLADGAVNGIAWSLIRGVNTASVGNVAWLGTESDGTDSNAVWTDATLADSFGVDLDLRIVLDTTGGAGTWTATWLAKLPSDGSYTVVRATELLSSEAIDSVGIARSNGGFTGDVTSFSLTSVPEPGSLALLAAGGLCILRRRRG